MLASLQTAARIAAAREESLLKSLNEAKADVSRSNDQGIELRALEREATAQRELLEVLPRALSRGGGADRRELPAGGRAHHFARRCSERAILPEEDDDVGRRRDRRAPDRRRRRASSRVHVRARLPGDRLRPSPAAVCNRFCRPRRGRLKSRRSRNPSRSQANRRTNLTMKSPRRPRPTIRKSAAELG